VKTLSSVKKTHNAKEVNDGGIGPFESSLNKARKMKRQICSLEFSFKLVVIYFSVVSVDQKRQQYILQAHE
jgi:hypothetical protein